MVMEGAVTQQGFSNDVLRRAAALGVTLRRARPEDAEDFAKLMNDESVYPQLMQMPYTDASFWHERLKDGGGPGTMDLSLVVEAEGRVVASAGLHTGPMVVRRRHAMFLGISVSREWQGRSTGDLLMMALCHHADRWLGILRLELTVYSDNERAMALYQKHGFVVEGTHRSYALRDGAYADVLSMARLNPQALQPGVPMAAAEPFPLGVQT